MYTEDWIPAWGLNSLFKNCYTVKQLRHELQNFENFAYCRNYPDCARIIFSELRLKQLK